LDGADEKEPVSTHHWSETFDLSHGTAYLVM
jgi:hypothetical protein